jgi:hypothetical protein
MIRTAAANPDIKLQPVAGSVALYLNFMPCRPLLVNRIERNHMDSIESED